MALIYIMFLNLLQGQHLCNRELRNERKQKKQTIHNIITNTIAELVNTVALHNSYFYIIAIIFSIFHKIYIIFSVILKEQQHIECIWLLLNHSLGIQQLGSSYIIKMLQCITWCFIFPLTYFSLDSEVELLFQQEEIY